MQGSREDETQIKGARVRCLVVLQGSHRGQSSAGGVGGDALQGIRHVNPTQETVNGQQGCREDIHSC